MPYKLWTPEEENQLKELVETGKYSYRQIGHIMNRSLASVTCHARQYLDINNSKYEVRKYQHDKDFFKSPNPINCYVAGFLAADGCIHVMKRGGYRILSLALAVADTPHLLKIKDLLKHEGGTFYSKKESGNGTNQFGISISQEYMNDLAGFGIVPRKAHRLTPPRFDNLVLEFSYLLGLLDGDGCIHLNNRNIIMCSLVSVSPMTAQWFQYVMSRLNFPKMVNKTPKIRKLKECSAYRLAYAGSRVIGLIQLAQAFADKYNLPILARKWRTPVIDQYVKDYYLKYPEFKFDPCQKLAEIENSSPSR